MKSGTAAALHPLHSSIYRFRGMVRLRPRGMERLRCTRDQAEAATRIALEIFTDCVNVGVPFQDALCAIYLSGLEHAVAASRERADGDS